MVPAEDFKNLDIEYIGQKDNFVEPPVCKASRIRFQRKLLHRNQSI